MYGSERVDPTRSRGSQTTFYSKRYEPLTGGVSGSVSTLMVTVQGNIETEVFGHVLTVSVAKHVGVVS